MPCSYWPQNKVVVNVCLAHQISPLFHLLAAGRVCPGMLESADTQPIAVLRSVAKTRLGTHHPDGQMLQIGTDLFFPFASLKEDKSNYLKMQSGLNEITHLGAYG